MPRLPSAVSKFLAKLSSSSTSSTSTKMAKQTITVFGATGKQGSSVVKSILGDSKASSHFNVKAVTRDPTKDSAKALASLGAVVVKARLTLKLSKAPTDTRAGRFKRQGLTARCHQRILGCLLRHQFLGGLQRRSRGSAGQGGCRRLQGRLYYLIILILTHL